MKKINLLYECNYLSLKKILRIMRIALFLLFVSILQTFANDTYSQSTRLSLDFSNAKLVDVMDEIEELSEFYFLFNEKLIDMNREVTLSVDNKKIEKILNKLFSKTDVVYTITDRKIILAPSFLSDNAQQEITIKGTVLDGQGLPLPGVTVLIKGTSRGVTTNVDGKYTIDVPDVNSVLVFSFLSYETQEIIIGNNTTLDLTLLESIYSIDEVVAIGYGTMKKANITGATTTIKMADVLGNRPVTGAAQALQGAIPGLQITTNSGQPGADGLGINIRGMSSINGGSPLILVDNVPVSINDVNPTDIESVTVLKDAASSSIYGARAAFGVVLITTKKAKKGEPIKFDYSYTASINSATEIPEVASPLEFVTALQDFGVDTYWALGESIDKWKGFIEQYNANPGAYPDGTIEDAGIIYGLKANNLIGDFLDDVGLTQIHNFSFSGGSEKSAYRVSLGYNDEDGIMVTDKDRAKRYNLNAYLSSEIAKNLTAELSTYYMKNENSFPSANYSGAIRGAIPTYPTGDHTNLDGTTTPYSTPRNQVIYTTPSKTENQNLRLFGKLNFTPVKGLSIIGEYTFETKDNIGITTNNAPDFVTLSTLTYTPGLISNTYYRKATTNSTYNAINVYANYKKSINDIHNFSVLLGYNYEQLSSASIWTSKKELISTDLPSISTATGTLDADDSFYEWAVQGGFGRLNYNYKEKYFLEANGRYDGSSRFPEDHKFGFFPSFSAGWNIARESFMEASGVATLKLRASWGQIGNQITRGYYPAVPGMSAGNANWINTSTGIQYTTLGDPGLVSSNFTWETVESLNFGLDATLLNNRLSASFDWYNRKTIDMIAAGAELPAVIGTGAPVANVADLESYGWEMSLAWKDRIKDFSYQIGFNLYDNQGKITKFDNEAGLLSQYYVGRYIGEIWGYVSDGFYTVDDFEDGTLNDDLTGGTLKEGVVYFKGVNPNPGDVKYKDLNDDGVIFSGDNTLEPSYDPETGELIPNTGPGDRKIIGNSNRRFQFGVNGSMSYKNFDLSFIIHGVGKRDLWVSNDLFWSYIKQFDNVFKHQLDYWTPENTDAYYPRNYPVDHKNYNTSRNVQTKYLSDGSYWNLRSVTVGYTLPKNIVNKIFIDNLRVYFSGENLFINDKLPKGMNPEFANKGRGGAYPFMKGYAFGLNVTF